MTVGNLTIQGNVQGAPTGARSLGPLITPLNTAVDQTLVVTLSVGANTITVPTGATVAAIVGPNAAYPTPNPTFSGTITLKGVSGDTGIAISNKYATVLQFDSAPASFVLTASVTTTVEVWFA
jgi:hypothetical protein